MNNIFTVDLEDWYHANYFGDPPSNLSSRFEKPTLKILKLLKSTHNQATFFVLSQVALLNPDLIKEISLQGHEIASHGHSHCLVYSQTPSEFERDLQHSLSILNKLSVNPVIGYRAPSWSVDHLKTPWFWNILKKHGLKYSSSLFPFQTFLYGNNHNPSYPHQIDQLLEIPPSSFSFLHHKFAYSGGFYLRLLPYPAIKFLNSLQNRHGHSTIFYIHPREIDPGQPRIKHLSVIQNFIHYYNISGTFNKLNRILTANPTISISTYLNQFIS